MRYKKPPGLASPQRRQPIETLQSSNSCSILAMPSVAWKLAAAAAAAAAARSRDGSGAVKHPPWRYHLISDPSSEAPPRPPIPPEFNDEEAYLPPDQRYTDSTWRVAGYLFNSDMRSDKKAMPFDKNDLESEKTLWALYNRWLRYFNVVRGVEKGYRFKIFKEKVDLICKLRSEEDLRLNHLCDVRIDELCPPKRSPRRR